MNLKRLWDTENKKMVRAKNSEKPYKALQVRTNDDGSKLYVYDHAQWIELQNPQSADVETYGPVWKSLTDETVGYYLTNEPTDLYSWDSGDEVAYRFMNGTTVLDSGTIDEGETPEYIGETPTKAATAQYTYTFSGWKPEVGPIYKKTDFKAQFTRTQNPLVSIVPNNAEYGSVDVSSIYAASGTAYWISSNQIGVGAFPNATISTATAASGYKFVEWQDGNGNTLVDGTVSEDMTVVAVFEVLPELMTYDELIQLTPDAMVTELNKYPQDYANSLTEDGHTLQGWMYEDYSYELTQGNNLPVIIDGYRIYMPMGGSNWTKGAMNAVTVSITSEDVSKGTITGLPVNADYLYQQMQIYMNGNTITFGYSPDTQVITAVPETGYVFDHWEDQYGYDMGDDYYSGLTPEYTAIAKFVAAS